MLVPSTSSSQLVLSSSLPGLPPIPVKAQDALDAAISQSQKSFEEIQREAIKQERRFFIFYGKKCHALEIESATLQKELAATQHNVEYLPKLYQEKWTAHLAVTHASIRALAEAISDFVKSFKQFQASFPSESISKMQDNAVPSPEWLTRLKTFVNERQVCPAASPSPVTQKVEAGQQFVPVHSDSILAEAASIPGVRPYLQELRTLEDHVAKVQGDLVVFKEREQSLRKQEAQAIESWNQVFVPCLDTAHAFQEKVITLLQQQITSLRELDDEYFRLSSRDLHYPCSSPARLQDLMRLMNIPGERNILIQRRDQTSPLQKPIELIVSLIEKMVVKQSVDEGKR